MKLIAFFILALTIPTAHAQTTHLTKANITDFITETTKLTAGHTEDLSPDEIITYLETHLHKNARFKTTMRYEIPGQSPQENAMRLNKEDFINKIRQSTETIEDYENEIDIIKIKISKDKRSATIETRSQENATLPVSDEDTGVTQIPMEGTSLCRQILKLNKKDIIQMYNINCVTDIAFDAGGF